MNYVQLINKYGSPLFVYNQESIRKSFELVQNAFNYPHFKILFAAKANSNIELLKLFRKLGAEIDASSPGDVFLAQKAGFDNNSISATGPNWTNADLDYFIKNKIHLDLDSISQIRRYGQRKPNSTTGIRINPGIGAGFHKSVMAGGPESKLGIAIENLSAAIKEAQKYNLKITGIHYHIGSSCYEKEQFVKAFKLCLDTADKYFPDLKYINIGGGLGIAFSADEKDFDVTSYGNTIITILEKWNNSKSRQIELRIELGEFLIWKAGALLTTVNTIKRNKNKTFAGVDANSNILPTPFLYGTHHNIRLVSRDESENETMDIAGNLCMAGDILAKNRTLPKLREGDILLIENAGAYCYSKSSVFNSRLRPAEILINGGKTRLIRKREKLQDLMITQNEED